MRFDPATETFQSWPIPSGGVHPRPQLVRLTAEGDLHLTTYGFSTYHRRNRKGEMATVLRALMCCVSKPTGGFRPKRGSTMLTTKVGFQQQQCRSMSTKRTEIALALVLVSAPLLQACGNEKLATEHTDRTSLVPNQKGVDHALRDLRTCLGTMKEVDGVAHAASGRGDFDRAFEVWRGSTRDGNVLSRGSLCIIHMSQSTPTRYRDYNEGFEACSSLALEDDATAQYVLGRMYGAGLGVEKNDTTALYWFKEAAEGGHETSQFITGLSYLTGKGLPKDLVLAYKWLNVASGNGVEKAAEARDLSASLLTRSELSEAQELTRSYTPRPVRASDSCTKWLAQRQKSY